MAATPAEDRPSQIYAVIEVGPGAAERLAALLAVAALEAVLFQPVAGLALAAQSVKPLVDTAQARNVAALLADDAALARTLRADGVHLSAGGDLLARYQEARSIVGAGVMVGVDAGGSRHLAMETGEAGADYIAFSADAPPVGTDEDDPGPRTRDALIAWWADVFEVPCVAFAAETAEMAAEFALAGADFVAVPFAGGEAVGDAAARLRAIVAAVEAVDAA